MLRVRDLTVRYPGVTEPAVRAVDLDLAVKGSLAVVGESGSGKSTTVLALTRLLDPGVDVTAAELLLDGENVTAMGSGELRALRRERVGMVFQDPGASWNPSRTLAAQLLDGLRRGAREEARDRLVVFLGRAGIKDADRRLDDYPFQFSGGMLQRALIAGALLHRPGLLIADEPTSALDSTVQREILELIDELRREQGLALVLVSHDLGVVAKMTERTMVMYAGRVIEESSTARLLAAPAHPYTANLIAATPRLIGPRRVRLGATRATGLRAEGCPYSDRCPLVTAECRAAAPPLRPVEGGQVACYHSDRTPTLLEDVVV